MQLQTQILVYAALIAGLTLLASIVGDWLIKRHRMRTKYIVALSVGCALIVAGLFVLAASRMAMHHTVVAAQQVAWPL